MMPPDALEQLRPFDAIYLGAVGDPRLQDNLTLNGLLLPIRRTFDQYACTRPAVLYKGVRSPLAHPGEIDFVVVRENTEGEYTQIGGSLYTNTPEEVAVQTAVFTRHGTERIIRFAFELARKRNKKVTSVDKANVLETFQFWKDVVTEVHRDYPDVQLEHMYVDNAAMQLVKAPGAFDVVVTGNMFGDILSDEAAMLTGSIGMLPSASLDKHNKGLYEPSHGSAPDIAGKGIANPLATILSAAMMLRFSLNQPQAADRIESAVKDVLASGLRTADIWSEGTTKVGTREMGDAVVAAITKTITKG